MLIQTQNSDVTVNTENADRPYDAFPPVFQIWDAPYSMCPHGYSVMFVPTFPDVDNVCLGKYLDLTQAAQAYAGIIYALNCGEKSFMMPQEKDLPALMHKRIVSERTIEEMKPGTKASDDMLKEIREGSTLPAYEARFKPDSEPKIVRCIPGHSVDKALAQNYIAYFWRTDSREWVVMGRKQK